MKNLTVLLILVGITQSLGAGSNNLKSSNQLLAKLLSSLASLSSNTQSLAGKEAVSIPGQTFNTEFVLPGDDYLCEIYGSCGKRKAKFQAEVQKRKKFGESNLQYLCSTFGLCDDTPTEDNETDDFLDYLCESEGRCCLVNGVRQQCPTLPGSTEVYLCLVFGIGPDCEVATSQISSPEFKDFLCRTQGLCCLVNGERNQCPEIGESSELYLCFRFDLCGIATSQMFSPEYLDYICRTERRCCLVNGRRNQCPEIGESSELYLCTVIPQLCDSAIEKQAISEKKQEMAQYSENRPINNRRGKQGNDLVRDFLCKNHGMCGQSSEAVVQEDDSQKSIKSLQADINKINADDLLARSYLCLFYGIFCGQKIAQKQNLADRARKVLTNPPFQQQREEFDEMDFIPHFINSDDSRRVFLCIRYGICDDFDETDPRSSLQRIPATRRLGLLASGSVGSIPDRDSRLSSSTRRPLRTRSGSQPR